MAAAALLVALAQVPAQLDAPIVDQQHAPVGSWAVAADGGVFALDGAPFLGSAAGLPLLEPVFAIRRADPGYALFARDGGVFAYGTQFHGSAFGIMPAHHQAVAVEMFPAGYLIRDDAGNTYSCAGTCVPTAPLTVLEQDLCGHPAGDDSAFVAAVKTYVDPSMWCWVAAMVQCESQWNRWAENSSSSASGYGQFLSGWWAGSFPGDWTDPDWQARAIAFLLANGGTSHWNASRECWG